ncbi:MAG: hypothetical protein ACO3F3_15935 [Gemmataceae bacterium]
MLWSVALNNQNAWKYVSECTHDEQWELIVDVDEDTAFWKFVFFGVNYVDSGKEEDWKYIPYPIDLEPIRDAIDKAVCNVCEEWYYELEDTRIPNLFRCNY